MAVIPNSKAGAPGLLFPLVTSSIETGVMKEAKDAEGGFPLYGKKGDALGCYVTKPSEDGYLKGFALRTLRNDKYDEGDTVNVIKKGRFYVKVLGQVVSGEAAYVNDTNNGITATASGATAIPGGVFKSNANDGELAELEIA